MPAAEPDPEKVLSQALRAMAGGPKATPPELTTGGSKASARLSTTQLLLLAALIGLVIGIAAGLASLLL